MFPWFPREAKPTWRDQPGGLREIEGNSWGIIKIRKVGRVIIKNAWTHRHNEISPWKHDEREVKHPKAECCSKVKVKAERVVDRAFIGRRCCLGIGVEVGRVVRWRLRWFMINNLYVDYRDR